MIRNAFVIWASASLSLTAMAQTSPTVTSSVVTVSMNLVPGYHVFSVLGTDVQGNLRTSDPRMVVVQSARQ